MGGGKETEKERGREQNVMEVKRLATAKPGSSVVSTHEG